jgi:hypothetical protein
VVESRINGVYSILSSGHNSVLIQAEVYTAKKNCVKKFSKEENSGGREFFTPGLYSPQKIAVQLKV